MMKHQSNPPGLADERTALAWNRSWLAMAVCVAVLVRHLWSLHGVGEDAAVLCIGIGAIVWILGQTAYTRARAGRRADKLLGPLAFRLITLSTLLLALTGFLLAWTVAP